MWAYALRRCLLALPTIAGILVATALLARLLPGDAAERVLGGEGDPVLLAETRRALGLDRPLLPDPALLLAGEFRRAGDCQVAAWTWGLLHGDLGTSWQTGQPVGELIGRGVAPSLSLMVPILIGSQLAGFALACLATVRRGAWDAAVRALAVGAMHLPALALVAAGQWLVAFQLGWLPVHGWSRPAHLALPVLLGVAIGFGGPARFYRALLVEEAASPYVRCARAKGCAEAALLARHVLPNVLAPVATRLALEIPHLILGSLLLERFFAIPGLGGLLVDAVAARDMPVLAAMTLLAALAVVAGTLLGDLVCLHLRQRTGER